MEVKKIGVHNLVHNKTGVKNLGVTAPTGNIIPV